MQNGEPGSSPFADSLFRGSVEGVADGSHRKSGVRNGVKNLCPVESFSLPCNSSYKGTHTLVRRTTQEKNAEIRNARGPASSSRRRWPNPRWREP